MDNRELTLTDLLADPMTLAVMVADRVDPAALEAALSGLARRLEHAWAAAEGGCGGTVSGANVSAFRGFLTPRQMNAYRPDATKCVGNNDCHKEEDQAVSKPIVSKAPVWKAGRPLPAGILGGIGLGVLSLGFILLALLPAQPGDASIIWPIDVCGFGLGVLHSSQHRTIVSNAPRERSGGAGAIQATARLLGQTIGAAVVALVFGYAGPGGGTSPTTAILIAAGFSALAVLASLSRLLNFVRLPRRTSVRGSGMANPHPDRVPVRSPP